MNHLRELTDAELETLRADLDHDLAMVADEDDGRWERVAQELDAVETEIAYRFGKSINAVA